MFGPSRYERLFEQSEKRYERLFEQSETRYQEQLRFTHEVVRRNEIAFAEGSRVMAELVESVRELTEGLRANTQATLKLLDRFANGGEGAAS